MLESRHLQGHGDANSTIVHYWAYPDRVLPCTSGTGTCDYLSAVYWMHTVSMLYTFIMWGVFLGILASLLWLRFVYTKDISRHSEIKTPVKRGLEAIGALGRRYLLPESPGRWFFGRVTMLQVAVLLTLSGYLLIFSLVGIVYKTWVTPVKSSPGLYSTRVGMGGFADRVGAMAYALTPFTIALSTRESLLSLITGIPYQHFNFLHRWTGRIIFIQSFLHTLIWTVIEGRLYQPQPSTYKAWISEQYILFGVVAQLFITFLYIFSTKWAIRWTGYEFFKRSHYVIAALYLGACWGHWAGLACWMIASIILLALDKAVRVIRTGLLHVGYRKGVSGLGFQSANATIQYFGDENTQGDGEVLRIDFDFPQPAWSPGQHFYLCFPAISLWQSHPFTPSSLPDGRSGTQHHAYLVRVRKGITAQLAQLAKSGTTTTSVVICGPYGGSDRDVTFCNLLTVAGGTGVTSVLPVLQEALTAPYASNAPSPARDFVWIVRYVRDLDWIAAELLEMKEMMSYGRVRGLRMKIFVTREDGPASLPSSATAFSSAVDEDKGKGRSCCRGEKDDVPVVRPVDVLAPVPGFEIVYLDHAHHCIEDVVADFTDRARIAGGESRVIGAGPEEIGTTLRTAVAKRNDASRAWIGDEEGIMGLEWDCRA